MKYFLFVRTREFSISRVCKLILSLTLVWVPLVARVGTAFQILKALSSLELVLMVSGASSMKLKWLGTNLVQDSVRWPRRKNMSAQTYSPGRLLVKMLL